MKQLWDCMEASIFLQVWEEPTRVGRVENESGEMVGWVYWAQTTQWPSKALVKKCVHMQKPVVLLWVQSRGLMVCGPQK